MLFFKRSVLSPLLKVYNDELFLTLYGKAFHGVGAASEKDLAPYVFLSKRWKV